MGAIANLHASLTWDIDDFQRGTRTINDGLLSVLGVAGRVSDAVGQAGRKMTAGMTLPLTGLGVLFTKVAADAAELQSAFDYTFGGMSRSMNRWAESSGDAMGRATQEMQEGALAFGQLFKSAAPTELAAARLSQRFTELAQDSASFFNTDFDTAMGKIRSGLTGEAEPLRDFGVFLTEAAVETQALEMGLISAGQELNEYGKVMARSALITEGLMDAQGDVERTSDSLSNRIRKIKGDLRELALEIGEILIPYAQKLAGVVEAVVEAFRGLPQWVKQAAVGFGVFLAAIGPVVVVLSSLATLILPLLLVRFMAMRGVIPPVLALLTALVNPLGAAVIAFGKLIGAAGAFRIVGLAAGAAMRAMLGPLGLLIGGVALLANNSKTTKERTDDLRQSNEELAAELRAAGVEVETFGERSGAASGGVNILTDSMERASEAGRRLIKTLARVAEIKELQKEFDRLERAKDRAKGVDAGTGYVQVESGGFLGVGIRKKEQHRVTKADRNKIAELNALEEQVAERMRLLAMAIEAGEAPAKSESGGTKDYAVAEDTKVPRSAGLGRVASGPTAKELADRRAEIALQQELTLARIRGDEEQIRLLERREELARKMVEYGSAGLSQDQARIAAELDLQEIDQARADAREAALADRRVDVEYQVALINHDVEHLRFLDQEKDLRDRIVELKRDGYDLTNAERIAQAEILQIEEAREQAAARRLQDQQREHEFELARLRGDSSESLRAREEAFRVGDRIAELMDGGEMSRAKAEEQALREAADRSQAHMQGTFRDAFRNGLRAAMDGNLGDFFENWMRERTFNALSRVLDRLADGLANLFAGSQSGGSGVGAFFASVVTSSASSGGSGAMTFGGNGGGISSAITASYPGIDKSLLSLNTGPTTALSGSAMLGVQPASIQSARPVTFDLRGAVMTEQLLNQMQAMADGAAERGASMGAKRGVEDMIDLNKRTYGAALGG